MKQNHGPILIVDGNLSIEALKELSTEWKFKNVHINFMIASARKAFRAKEFLHRKNFTLYLNRSEAERLSSHSFQDSREAARFVHELGFERVVVTDSGREISDCNHSCLVTANPKEILVETRVLGAGDNFMAAHMTAENQGMDRTDALAFAAGFARNFVTR